MFNISDEIKNVILGGRPIGRLTSANITAPAIQFLGVVITYPGCILKNLITLLA